MSDPLPLSAPQLAALASAAARELWWGLRAVSTHVARWKALAATIPDRPLRETALRALADKRGHADGAALFAVLPRRREAGLLELLVAYQVMLDFLDSAHEQAPDEANGRQLHLALVDALDPGRPLSDWYRHHPWPRDGGYLRALVQTCRAGCRALSSFEAVRALLVREAWHGQVLALNHLTDPQRRDAALRGWAAAELPDAHRLEWYEVCSTASSTLVVHVLLALATDPGLTAEDVGAADVAYWWVSFVANMLDSYVDQPQDEADGQHSYVAHYPSPAVAVARIAEGIDRAARATRVLRGGPRHAVVCACMIALYLSKRGAGAGPTAGSTHVLIHAGGSLTRLLVPVLRAWRVAYGQQSV